MASPRKLHEQSFNSGLAQAIRSRKPSWAGEGRDIVQDESLGLISGTSERPDILIDDPLSPPVVIEVSFDCSDAVRDARARLGRVLARGGATVQAAVAVCLPPEYRELRSTADVTKKLLDGGCMDYVLVQGAEGSSATRWPVRGQLCGGLDDLIAVLPAVSQSSETIARLADDVAKRVKWCADRLEAWTHPEHQADIARSVRQRMPWHGLTTTSVLWLNALLSQGRLSNTMAGVVSTLASCTTAEGQPIPSKVRSAWHAALSINYGSIFVPALASLRQAMGASIRGTSEGLECLFEAAERIEMVRLGSYIDIGAELFPRLSDDQKTSAAFYTRPATAELLACLAIRESVQGDRPIDWGDSNLGRNVRIADTACGTGTLVRAGYRQIRYLHEKAGGRARELHRDFMEHGVMAVDISAIAAHLTATSLSAMEPDVPYGDVQIGCVPVGGPDRTGSLEFLDQDEVGDLFQRSFEASRGRESRGQSDLMSARLPSLGLQYFLANPPYSRTRGGQSLFDVKGLSASERRNSQKRASRLGRGTCANLKAGLPTFFLAKADKKLRPGGTMAFVLPLTAGSADSYRDTRKMIEDRYRDVVALTVAGGATGEESLSSETGMSEMLLVATKGPALQSAPSPVVCVNLYQGVTEIGHARETARAVLHAIMTHPKAECGEVRVGKQSLGNWVRRTDTGKGDPWSELGVADAELAVAAAKLLRGELIDLDTRTSRSLPVPLVALERLFEVGPTHDRIGHLAGKDPRGAFEFHPLEKSRPVTGQLSVWKADSKQQRNLCIDPTHYGRDPSHPDHALQDRMRAGAGTLFYARNLRWTSQALLAATTERAVMGGRAWTVLRHDDERVCKAFALWANSTLGLIVQWTQGGRQQQGRSLIQVGAIRKTPVPDLDKLAPEKLDEASEAFLRLQDQVLLPACQAHVDETREAIDQAVLQMFGFADVHPPQAQVPHGPLASSSVDDLRKVFSREPQIHGNNREALRLLGAT